jgi:ABC-type sugar transport system ATPase subunit
MKKELLRIENLKKGTLLKGVELQVFEGEIIHCVFDNIQAKSLFFEIVTGAVGADYGRVYYEEQKVLEKDMFRVLKSSIEVISMDSRLIDSVTIEENLFLIRPQVKGQWVRQSNYRKETLRLFEQFEIFIDMERPVSRLAIFEKVQIEILKAYLLDKKVIMLTALSNCLSDQEIKSLWKLLEKLRRKGVSFVVVEPLEDINFFYTDTVVIIRHGRTCMIKDVDNCDYTMLHTILYRNEMEKGIEDWKIKQEQNYGGEVKIENVSTAYLKNVSFTVGKGEIVKLFCIDERSYEEMIVFMKGETEIFGGRLWTGGIGREMKKTMGGLKDRIGVVEGNPRTASLFSELTAMDNLQMLLSHKVSGMWMISKYKKSVRRLLGDIIPDDVYGRKIKELSPSDIQKIVYCRWLIYSPHLLVCIQPFAEGDIQARETVRQMLYTLESRKIPVLIITANTAEFNYCQGRELYMRHGRMISKKEAYEFIYSKI